MDNYYTLLLKRLVAEGRLPPWVLNPPSPPSPQGPVMSAPVPGAFKPVQKASLGRQALEVLEAPAKGITSAVGGLVGAATGGKFGQGLSDAGMSTGLKPWEQLNTHPEAVRSALFSAAPGMAGYALGGPPGFWLGSTGGLLGQTFTGTNPQAPYTTRLGSTVGQAAIEQASDPVQTAILLSRLGPLAKALAVSGTEFGIGTGVEEPSQQLLGEWMEYGKAPTRERYVEVAKEAALPTAYQSALMAPLGLAGSGPATKGRQAELPLTGGRVGEKADFAAKVTAPVAAHIHNAAKDPKNTGSTTPVQTRGSVKPKAVPKTGYAVGLHPNRTLRVPGNRVDPRTLGGFLMQNWNLFENDPNLYLGTWFNPEDGQTYIDASAVIQDKAQALKVAKENGEIAIWDLAKKETIFVDYGSAEQMIFPFAQEPEKAGVYQMMYPTIHRPRPEPVRSEVPPPFDWRADPDEPGSERLDWGVQHLIIHKIQRASPQGLVPGYIVSTRGVGPFIDKTFKTMEEAKAATETFLTRIGHYVEQDDPASISPAPIAAPEKVLTPEELRAQEAAREEARKIQREKSQKAQAQMEYERNAELHPTPEQELMRDLREAAQRRLATIHAQEPPFVPPTPVYTPPNQGMPPPTTPGEEMQAAFDEALQKLRDENWGGWKYQRSPMTDMNTDPGWDVFAPDGSFTGHYSATSGERALMQAIVEFTGRGKAYARVQDIRNTERENLRTARQAALQEKTAGNIPTAINGWEHDLNDPEDPARDRANSYNYWYVYVNGEPVGDLAPIQADTAREALEKAVAKVPDPDFWKNVGASDAWVAGMLQQQTPEYQARRAQAAKELRDLHSRVPNARLVSTMRANEEGTFDRRSKWDIYSGDELIERGVEAPDELAALTQVIRKNPEVFDKKSSASLLAQDTPEYREKKQKVIREQMQAAGAGVPVEMKYGDMVFPVWDFTKNAVVFPDDTGPNGNAVSKTLAARINDAYGGTPLTPNDLARIKSRISAVTPQEVVRLLRHEDPKMLNVVLSRAVSAAYGDRGARAMLEMIGSTSRPVVRRLIENILAPFANLTSFTGRPYTPEDVGKRFPVIEQGQATLWPLGEVPPIMRLPSQDEAQGRVQDEVDDAVRQHQETARQKAIPGTGPRMVYSPVDVTWRIYDEDGNSVGATTNKARAEEYMKRFLADPESVPSSADYTIDPGARVSSRKVTSESIRAFWDSPIEDGALYIGDNMEVYVGENTRHLKLFGSTIASYDRNTGDLTLTDAGHQTATTKERLNALLTSIGYPKRITQKSGEWYLGDQVWPGKVVIPNVQSHRGGYAHNAPTPSSSLPAFQKPRPGEFNPQLSLPGISPETRQIRVKQLDPQRFQIVTGRSSLIADVTPVPHLTAPVLRLRLNIDPKEQRADATVSLVEKAMDVAVQENLAGLMFPPTSGGLFPAIQYAAYARGFIDVAENSQTGEILLGRVHNTKADAQAYARGYGAHTSYSGEPHALPPVENVSDEMFKQMSPKFITESSVDVNAANDFATPFAPMQPDERRAVMAALESLEARGLPPVITNLISRIAKGGFENSGNLALINAANGRMSLSSGGTQQLFDPDNRVNMVFSMAHELGHAASISTNLSSWLDSSPLFTLAPGISVKIVPDPASGTARLEFSGTDKSGYVAQEAFKVAASAVQFDTATQEARMRPDASLMGNIFQYPIMDPIRGGSMSASTIRRELFAQAWAAYLVFPDQLQTEMPQTYNLMHELMQYGKQAKTYDGWDSLLKLGLRVKGTKTKRKAAVKGTISPFQGAMLHNTPVSSGPIQTGPIQLADEGAELDVKAGTAVAGDSTGLTDWATAIAQTTREDWELAKGGVIPHTTTKNSAINLAARVGFDADEVSRILADPKGQPGEAAQGLAMAATTSRVNLARAVNAPDVATFAKYLADAANMLVVARTQASEAGRALGHWGWMIREGKTAAETQSAMEKAVDAARKFMAGKETFQGEDIIKALGGEQAADLLRASMYYGNLNGTLNMENMARAFNAMVVSGLNRKTERGPLRRLLDMPLEWFRISVLTGPATHEVNLMSTTTNVALHDKLVEPIAAAINFVTHAPDQPGFKNYKNSRALLGVTRSLGDVVALTKFGGLYEYPGAQLSLLAGMNPYQQQAALAMGEDKWRQENAPALPGKFGKAARTVGFGLLGAEDAAIKALILRQEIAVQMDMEGLPWDGVSEVPADVMASAMEKADRLTFNARVGELAAHLNGVVRDSYVGSWVVLFVRAMSNIIKTGVSYTPGANLAIKEEREALMKPHSRAQNEALARMAVGSSLFALVAMLRSDPDEPDKYLTGPSPKKWAERNVWMLENGNLAIRTSGGKQYEIYRMEPLNIILSSMIGAVDAINEEDATAEQKIAMAAQAMAQAPLNAHFLVSVSDLVEAMTSEGEEDILHGERFGRWVARTGAAMTVPQFSAQAAQFLDPLMRAPEPTSYTEQVKARIPGLRETLPPRLDIRGQEIPETRYHDLLPAIPTREGANDPLAQQMLKWDKGMGYPKSVKGASIERQKAILQHQWQTLTGWMPYADEDEFDKARRSYSARKETRALRGGATDSAPIPAPPKWRQTDASSGVTHPTPDFAAGASTPVKRRPKPVKPKLTPVQKLDVAGGAADQSKSDVTKELVRINRGLIVPPWTKQLSKEEREEVLADRWRMLEEGLANYQGVEDMDEAKAAVNRILSKWSRKWKSKRDELKAAKEKNGDEAQ